MSVSEALAALRSSSFQNISHYVSSPRITLLSLVGMTVFLARRGRTGLLVSCALMVVNLYASYQRARITPQNITEHLHLFHREIQGSLSWNGSIPRNRFLERCRVFQRVERQFPHQVAKSSSEKIAMFGLLMRVEAPLQRELLSLLDVSFQVDELNDEIMNSAANGSYMNQRKAFLARLKEISSRIRAYYPKHLPEMRVKLVQIEETLNNYVPLLTCHDVLAYWVSGISTAQFFERVTEGRPLVVDEKGCEVGGEDVFGHVETLIQAHEEEWGEKDIAPMQRLKTFLPPKHKLILLIDQRISAIGRNPPPPKQVEVDSYKLMREAPQNYRFLGMEGIGADIQKHLSGEVFVQMRTEFMASNPRFMQKYCEHFPHLLKVAGALCMKLQLAILGTAGGISDQELREDLSRGSGMEVSYLVAILEDVRRKNVLRASALIQKFFKVAGVIDQRKFFAAVQNGLFVMPNQRRPLKELLDLSVQALPLDVKVIDLSACGGGLEERHVAMVISRPATIDKLNLPGCGFARGTFAEAIRSPCMRRVLELEGQLDTHFTYKVVGMGTDSPNVTMDYFK